MNFSSPFIDSSPTRGSGSRDFDIFDAIEKRDLQLVDKFLNIGKNKIEDVYSNSSKMMSLEGYTPLALACQLGAVDIVEYLLKKGANPNKFIRQMTDCFYVIHVACKGGNIDVITLLEKYNVKMEVKTTFDEETPLYTSVKERQYEVLKHLLEMGMRDNYTNRNGRCIHTCCEMIGKSSKNPKAELQINTENKILSLLLRYHSTNYMDDYANAKTKEPKADSSNKELQRKLLAERSPLLILTQLDAPSESIELLIEKNADVNYAHPDTLMTPLHYACLNNNEKVVKTLLLHGANKLAISTSNHLPGDLTRNKNIVEMLNKFSRFDTIIENAKRIEKLRIIDDILHQRSIPEEKVEAFAQALEYMKLFKIDKFEQEMLNTATELRTFFTNYLVEAAEHENKDAIRFLIKRYDVDINQLTVKGVKSAESIEFARQCYLEKKEKILAIVYNGQTYSFKYTSSTSEFELRNFINQKIIKNRIVTMREIRFEYTLNSKVLWATTSELFRQMMSDAYKSGEEVFRVTLEYKMEDWTEIRELGRGQFGCVMLCIDHNDKTLFALKVIDCSKIKRELDVYKKDKVKHENIVQYFDYKSGNGKYYIKIQYLPGGNLFELVNHLEVAHNRHLTMHRLALYTRQLLSAVDYLHKNHIYHCDIKPHNILIETTDCIKLADFGEANPEGTTLNHEFGTIIYLPPEVIKASHVTIDYSIDIWSIGVTVLQLYLGGKNPYELIPNFLETYQQSASKQITLQKLIVQYGYQLVEYLPSSCDSSLKAFLKKCLKNKGRPTTESLLSHPFLKKYYYSDSQNIGFDFSQETGFLLQYLNERQHGAKKEEQNAPQLIENQSSVTLSSNHVTRRGSSIIAFSKKVPEFDDSSNHPFTPKMTSKLSGHIATPSSSSSSGRHHSATSSTSTSGHNNGNNKHIPNSSPSIHTSNTMNGSVSSPIISLNGNMMNGMNNNGLDIGITASPNLNGTPTSTHSDNFYSKSPLIEPGAEDEQMRLLDDIFENIMKKNNIFDEML
ncbi:hypothetical protein C9374_010110 [Naegleria lovaniensis]|uniref:Protein kinase domain-containing protein n=1 Tax=Naegleria lovaniensis TaxID=51637 RepID=A0AA88GJ46_NAELO|nr:uncharacterized protein C9374_010110 [Naegleria lovaniensis]KAG2375106.1 hypothetical protein C9374_010110 [Naegleria lovaniensis]